MSIEGYSQLAVRIYHTINLRRLVGWFDTTAAQTRGGVRDTIGLVKAAISNDATKQT